MKVSALLCGAMVAFVPAQAWAQEAPAEESSTAHADSSGDIIVTAQRRSERLVDVPVSVDAISSEEMATKQINSVFDLGKSVTSLRFEGQAPTFMPTLRGVGTLLLSGSLDASVPVYVDGVYLPNTRGMNFDLPSIDGMQVLKGPQGTLFGRNSTGGAILITTSEPSDVLTARFKLGYAEYNDMRAQGYVSGPLTDNIRAGLSVSYRKSDGYTKNIVTGADDDARAKMFFVRPEILLTNNEGLSVRLMYEHSYAFDTTALGLNNPDGFEGITLLAGLFGLDTPVIATKPWETSANGKPINRNVADAGTAIVDWEIDDALTLKNVTSYRADKNRFLADADLSQVSFFHVSNDVFYRTFSNEMTLNGKVGKLDFVAGLYYYWGKIREADSGLSIIFGQPSIGGNFQHVKSETVAAFLDTTYEVAPGLFLTAGGRYSTERKDFSIVNSATGQPVPLRDIPGIPDPNIPDHKRWNSFTPRAAIRYQIDPGTNVYASYSRGYKTGTYSGAAPIIIDPENLNAYEVGFKHSAPRFSLNAAAFYYDYRNVQVTAVDANDPSKTNSVNAEKARTYGAELELNFRPTPEWTISVAGAYLDAKFIRFANAPKFVPSTALPGTWTTINVTADGTRMPRSPKWSGNLATSYDIDVGSGIVQLSANVNAATKNYNVANLGFPVDTYAEVGANISYTTADKHWRGELFVTNLTDHARPQQYQGGPLGTYAIWAPPRVIGASISFTY
ncbi:TonB-dependent receptor [Sphingopyxis sp. 550A]